MSIEKDEAAIQALLLSCGMDSGDIKETPTIVQKDKVVKPLKYIKFDKDLSKEEKYLLVVKELLKVVDIEFLTDMKECGWLTINYSRPYKDSNGGPIILIGFPTSSKSCKDIAAGRQRYGEINSRFPIFNLCTDIRAKYNEYKPRKTQAA